MKKHLKSKTFFKTYVMFCLILFIPITIFFISFYMSVQNENEKALKASFDEKAFKATKLIDSKFIEVFAFSHKLLNLNWIIKYMNDNPSFYDEFTEFDKLNYSNQLSNYNNLSGFVSNMSVVFPYRNTVVNSEGWFNKKNYISRMLLIQQADLTNIVNQIESLETQKNATGDFRFYSVDENYLLFTISLELIEAPRAYSIFLVDKKALQYEISQITGLSNTDVVVLNDNSITLKMNNNIEDNNFRKAYTISNKSVLSNWSLDYTYDYPNITFVINQFYLLFLATLFSFVVGIFVAYWLALIAYKPLLLLLNKAGYSQYNKKPLEKEYEFLEDTFDFILLENSLIKKDAQLYLETLRNNVLIQLLKGYFEDSGTELNTLYEIEFDVESYFCVFIVCNDIGNLDLLNNSSVKQQSSYEINTVIDVFLHEFNLTHYIVETANNDIVVMLSLPPHHNFNELLDQMKNDILLSLENMTGAMLPFYIGSAEKGIVGISKSYQVAKEKQKYNTNYVELDFDEQTDPYYFPTEWEIQLITNIKLGKSDIVSKIISEINLENTQRNLSSKSETKVQTLLIETLMRVLLELDIDVNKYSSEQGWSNPFQKNLSWDNIAVLSNNICIMVQHENQESPTENKLADYLHKNYSNSILSLKELSVKFGMSISVVSKVFKEQTGVNFYTYLSKIRMEKSKELLKTGIYDISTIANMVGYENEYSFRRAFLRYEGIKPKEFK